MRLQRGIIFPRALAPFEVAIAPIGIKKSEAVRNAAEQLYTELTAAGIEVLLDDRDESAGRKFNDADLIGIPYRIVIGKKALSQGNVEIKIRRTGEVRQVAKGEAVEALIKLRADDLIQK